MLVFLSCLATGALAMALAQRRARAIRLRVARRLAVAPQGSWEAWRAHPPRAGDDWRRQP